MKVARVHEESLPLVSATVLVDMMRAFAGPAEAATQRAGVKRRSASRRAVIVCIAAAVLIGASVPASLAIVRQLSESPQKFVRDRSQPLSARKAIQRFLARGGFGLRSPRLTGIRRVVSADTPEGTYGVYALTFSRKQEGIALISSASGDAGVAGLSAGPPLACPLGWSLRAGISVVRSPGRTPVYVTGQAALKVASVEVDYPDGHASSGALSNGYFLVWVMPTPAKSGARRGGTPSVTVVARDSTGKALGELHVRGDGEVPREPGQSRHGPSCG
jgi:hypothetical protein